jgi:predicted membrane-bound mannosyltransferase
VQLIVFVACAVVTSVVLFSQFFMKWGGVWDSIATYWNMLGRAGGQGHEKPFGYYLKLLWGGSLSGREISFWQDWKEIFCITPDARRAVVTEGVLMILAIIGCFTAFTAKASRNQSNHLMRFLAVYSVALFLIYSVISYKTPWCILSAWHGLLLMAGIGADSVIRLFWQRGARRTVIVLLSIACTHLALEAWRTSRDFANETRNPYNYSMTSPDVLDWVAKFERFATLHAEGRNMGIDQSDPEGGWPLPWYLSRRFPNYHWKDGGAMDIENAAVLLFSKASDDKLHADLAAQPGQEEAFGQLYAPFGITLHPSESLRVYVKRTLWDQYVSRPDWPPLAVQK